MTRRRARLSAAMLLAAVGLAGLLPRAASAEVVVLSVVELRLTGVVDDFMADYIATNIKRAEEEGAAAILLTIDTPGGLGSSMERISQSILNAAVPVICYVSPSGARAASAGAIILLSCPVAAMAPGTHVGASTPVGLGGGDLSNKIANDAAATARALAQTYDRNEEVAASFVTEGRSITAEEALEAGVIDLIASGRAELLAEIDGRTVRLGDGATTRTLHTDASVVTREIGGFVGFLHGLFDPSLAFVFFWLGLILLVLELIVPGHIFSGTVGTVLLLMALWSFGLLPVRWIGVLLLIASVVCFVIELKAPGLGVWGVLGVITLLLGGWFLFDRAGGVQVSPVVLVVMAAAVSLFFGFVVSKALALRRMPAAQGAEVVVGKEGVVIGSGVNTTGGLVRVASEEWRAVTTSNPIPVGAAIRVTRLDGLVLTVEPLHAEHAPATSPVKEGS